MEKKTKLIKHNITIGDSVSYGIQGEWYPDGTVIVLDETKLVTSKGHKYRLAVVPDVVKGASVQREKFFAVNGGRKWELKKSDTSGK